MFALIDCNNFYVSCERLFRPDLWHRPVAVLSNNDGCIVARSSEVKAMGIAMGTPIFQVREALHRHRVVLFSSNYALYGDLSQRVMDVTDELVGGVEPYSIDEAFVRLGHRPSLRAVGDRIRAGVYRSVGIPVSVGIATTRTLAKVANRVAKKRPDGVYVLPDGSSVSRLLDTLPVGDVWGIGRRGAAKLAAANVVTAGQFTAMPEAAVRQLLTITGLRTHRELRGHSCLDAMALPQARRSMCRSRSLGRVVSELRSLSNIVATFSENLGMKLRRSRLCASHLRLFLIPPRRESRRGRDIVGELPCSTSDSRVLSTCALSLLARIYRDRLPVKKVGLMVLGLLSVDGLKCLIRLI